MSYESPLKIITQRFVNQARNFISEIINHTRNYRSLQSLSGQVAEQYKDRFLIELIQNAHDASYGGEVRLILQAGGSQAETLYVANRGGPFQESNLESICTIGVTDKDLTKAIGNKGLGFHSVLHICDTPEIFSVHPRRRGSPRIRKAFDGFCFYFAPDTAKLLAGMLAAELQTSQPSDEGHRFFGKSVRLFSSSDDRKRFQEGLRQRRLDLMAEAMMLRSYAMPRPFLTAPQDPILDELCTDGFVTVVRLRLKDSRAGEIVHHALDEVSREYLLFLHRISKLTVERRGQEQQVRRFLRKLQKATAETPFEQVQLLERTDERRGQEQRFLLHSGDVDPVLLERACASFPDPEWRARKQARVSIALPINRETLPEPGHLSIFLPTEQSSGMNVWVNGPFYGDLARRTVNFSSGDEYNCLLRSRAAALVEEMREQLAAQSGDLPAILLLDLCHLRSTDRPFAQAVRAHWKSVHESEHAPCVRAASQGDTSLLKPTDAALLQKELLSNETLTLENLCAAGATLPVEVLYRQRYEVLAEMGAARPDAQTVARWIEGLARAMHCDQAPISDWQCFYEELARLMKPDEIPMLAYRKILLCKDGRLLAGSGNPRVFAEPQRRRTGDSRESPSSRSPDPVTFTEPSRSTPKYSHEEPGGQEASWVEIPRGLSEYIAFFSPEIDLRRSPRAKAAGELLQGTKPLVASFNSRSIVQDVLRPLTERLKREVRANDPDAKLCEDAFRWGFFLWQRSQQDRDDRGDERAFTGSIRVPTEHGWVSGRNAYFSAGWPGEDCLDLEHALKGYSQRRFLIPRQQVNTLLGSDSMTLIADATDRITAFMSGLGVISWPVLVQVTRKDTVRSHWLRFVGKDYRPMRGSLYSGLAAGLGLPTDLLDGYSKYISDKARVPLLNRKSYSFEAQTWIDGLGTLPDANARILASLIARYHSKYEKHLDTTIINMDTEREMGKVPTLLGYALRETAWLPAAGPQGVELRRPSEAWGVRAREIHAPIHLTKFRFIPCVLPEIVNVLPHGKLVELRRPLATDSSLQDALSLLSDLEVAYQGDLPQAELEQFADFWREALVQAAKRLSTEGSSHNENDETLGSEHYDSEDEETGQQTSGSRRPTGLLLLGPRGPRWCRLITEDGDTSATDDSKPMVYFPDDPSLAHLLAGELPIALVKEERRDLARKQFKLLTYLFGRRVSKLSSMKFTPYMGEARIDTLPLGAGRLLAEHRWLGMLTLSILAFACQAELEIESKTYLDFMNRLSEIQLAWIHGLRLITPSVGSSQKAVQPGAYYDARLKVLLVSLDHPQRDRDLAACLHVLLKPAPEFEMFEMALALALSALPLDNVQQEVPSEEELLRALKNRLRIDDRQYRQVERSLFSTSVVYTRQRCLPALGALLGWQDKRSAAMAEKTISGPDEPALIRQLGALLGQHPDVGWTGDTLWLAAFRAESDADLARELYRASQIDLSAWNRAAHLCGDRHQPIRNENLDDQFDEIRTKSTPVVRALIRQTVISALQPEKYLQYCTQAENLRPAEHFETQYWELPEQEGLRHLGQCLVSILAPLRPDRSPVELFSQANTVLLLSASRAYGLDLDFDEAGSQRQALARIAECFQQVSLSLTAFLSRSHPRSKLSGLLLEQGWDALAGDEEVRSLAACGVLDDRRIFERVLSFIRSHQESVELSHLLPESLPSSLAELQEMLAVRPQDIKNAHRLLEEVKEVVEQRQRTYSIAGVEYTLRSDRKLNDLEDLLDGQLPKSLGDGISLRSPRPLEVAPKLPPQRPGGKPVSWRPYNRPPPERRDLVAAVGEFLCYKYLLPHWLGRAPTRELWVSRYSERFFDGEGDESHGCDIKFDHNNKLWKIEVKSHTNWDDYFELTASEVAAAQEAARQRPTQRYVVVVVMHVLSQKPEFVVVGNPYDKARQDRFRIAPGGAVVFFKPSN